MSSGWPPEPGAPASFPPPGAPAPAPSPPPGWRPAPAPPGWTGPPGPPPGPPGIPGPTGFPGTPGFPGFPGLTAAHKPGAVPLRPLGLTDIYDAAFRIIRFNPRATVGAAVVVAALSMLVPVVVTSVLTATSSLAIDAGVGSGSGADLAALLGTAGSFVVGSLLQWIGTLLVTGLVVHVTMAAAVGRRLSLGEAWAATRGSRLRLVAMSLLTLLAYVVPIAVYGGLWVAVVLVGVSELTIAWGVLSVPAFLALMLWLWIRVAYLPVPALMVERTGPLQAFRRAFGLTRRQFWRTLGIAVLTLVVTGIASQVLTTPISLVFSLVLTGLGPDYYLLSLVLTQAITTVVAAAFVTPFTAAVTSLQYVDQRMRKEAFDVELMQRAGITAR